MLRSMITAAIRTSNHVRQQSQSLCLQPMAIIPQRLVLPIPQSRGLSMFPNKSLTTFIGNTFLKPLDTHQITQNRTVTKFSLNKGKRKSVKAVIKRFKRLDWGCWIRTHSGRHKKLFKKSPELRRRLKQHVLVNAQQSTLLDKMVTSFWRRPKHYVDDPYKPYMKREEYWATRSKPIGS